MNEETFGAELARRADDVHGAPLTFEQVRRRAHGIRRRRRALASGAAAAVVAAAIVLPAALSGGTDRSAPEPAAPPSAPGSSVLHGGVVTEPDGTTVRIGVENDDVVDFGVLTDGRVVAALQQPDAIRVYAPDGSLEHQYAVAANVITMSAADDAVAWVGRDEKVRVLASGSAEPTVLGTSPMLGGAPAHVDAVLDPEHVLIGDHTTTTAELTPDGVQALAMPGIRVTDVSPDGGLWAGSFLPQGDQPYGCSALYDPAAGRVVARSCTTPPNLSFSPDGRHLLGATGENNMAVEVAVLDLDLQPVSGFLPESEGVAVSRVGWADATHLVGSTVDLRTDQWSLVRVGLDGTVTDPVAGPAAGGDPERFAEYVVSD
jgi:hypothetical protein